MFTDGSTVVAPAAPATPPAAATTPLSRAAVPTAVSHPKNAEPHLMPPKRRFCSCRASCRSARVGRVVSAGPAGTSAGVRSELVIMGFSFVGPADAGP